MNRLLSAIYAFLIFCLPCLLMAEEPDTVQLAKTISVSLTDFASDIDTSAMARMIDEVEEFSDEEEGSLDDAERV